MLNINTATSRVREIDRWTGKYLQGRVADDLQNRKIEQIRILAQSWLYEEDQKQGGNNNAT